MSWWTNTRNAVTGTVAPLVGAGVGLLGGGLGGGGLMGLLGGLGGGGMGGGMMNGGYGGGFGSSGGFSGFGEGSGSLMEMFNKAYPQMGQVDQTGTTDLRNQGLI